MLHRSVIYFALFLTLGIVGDAAADPVRIGVMGGGVWSRISFSEATPLDVSARVRAIAGLSVSRKVHPLITLESRVVWQRKVTQLRAVSQTAIALATLDYVSFPALLRLEASGRRLRPYVLAGDEFSIRVGARMAVTPGNGAPSVDEAGFGDKIRRMDIALNFGGGIECPAGSASLFVEGLYSLGLVNLVSDRNAAAQAGLASDSFKSRGVVVTAGVRF